jgi:hypothetical protein
VKNDGEHKWTEVGEKMPKNINGQKYVRNSGEHKLTEVDEEMPENLNGEK